MRPFSTSGIDALPKWFDAESPDGVDEQFVRPLPQFEIGRGDIFHDVGDLRVGDGRADQRTEFRIAVGRAAERDLIELLAVLLNAQNANVADVMMAARVDAAGNVD